MWDFNPSSNMSGGFSIKATILWALHADVARIFLLCEQILVNSKNFYCILELACDLTILRLISLKLD